ncbi:hypothetical protein [Algibacter sp. 2305UL17-15]|uniref:hypothetical protein n=1 Tax=Algibacter sp. 2305UL17-15 TaxID=3231268 RepID=UPI00345AC64D
MKKVKLYGRIRLNEGKLFFITALLDNTIFINDKVIKIIINEEIMEVNCSINQILISFGIKRLDSLEIQKGYKGLISLDCEFKELNILPEAIKGWQIDDDNEIYLIID